MSSIEELKNNFKLPSVQFVEENGIILIDVNNPSCTARISMQGAHLMFWKPSDQEKPVIWLSEDAKIAPGKSIRGGIPVCWPWFGPHENNDSFPAHGFARTVPWELLTADEENSVTRLKFRLIDDESFKNQWPHTVILDLTISLGNTLQVDLATTNSGRTDFVIGEALHTYLEIGDIENISVEGLDKAEYIDKVDQHSRKKESGEIRFASEVDRVYLNTTSECSILDSILKRKIRISKSGSMSTVVWTPWQEKADKMGDMGKDNGWKKMVCIESGNALDNCKKIAPGERHTLTAIYKAENI
ncbi:MAG: D-hexose-6-phosphate mutarotase [Spirochaetia bacterium]|nr:D-hexose-6-phosphate mutarotase [Spirochaetia bacterium]